MNDIKWAAKQLELGKRVRRRDWGVGVYLTLDGYYPVVRDSRDHSRRAWNPSLPTLFATDFELYEPEPPKRAGLAFGEAMKMCNKECGSEMTRLGWAMGRTIANRRCQFSGGPVLVDYDPGCVPRPYVPDDEDIDATDWVKAVDKK